MSKNKVAGSSVKLWIHGNPSIANHKIDFGARCELIFLKDDLLGFQIKTSAGPKIRGSIDTPRWFEMG